MRAKMFALSADQQIRQKNMNQYLTGKEILPPLIHQLGRNFKKFKKKKKKKKIEKELKTRKKSKLKPNSL